MQSRHARVEIDLGRIRRNTAEIAARVKVPIWATVKADAYGLGAAEVARAIVDLVEGWSLSSIDEAQQIDLWNATKKPAITLGPPGTLDPEVLVAAHVRPAVTTVDEARQLADARPILCVDTGMQRFGCPAERVDEVIAAGAIDEAFTHATSMAHVRRLVEAVGGKVRRMHAAASSLLDEPEALLDAVRPGIALYRGAVRVTARLVEVHESRGPIGYTGWTSPTGRHAVIRAGYAAGLRAGPVLANGRGQRCTEVGMQSGYVTADAKDRPGDEVVLLGEGGGGVVSESDIAAAQNTTPHEALLRMAGGGIREYRRS